MLKDSEIQALVKLLDDEDRQVLRHVEGKLKSLGPDVIPSLENVWTTELNPLQHERLESIIHEIQFTSLTDDLQQWKDGEEQDLLFGFYLVSRFYYPDARFEDVQKQIFKLRQTIWLELNNNQKPLDQVKVFNSIFFGYLGFSGQQLSEDPKAYCLPFVLDHKEGCSISLGLLYQVLANELNLPVYGVPLLRYFVLAFTKRFLTEFENSNEISNDVAFYINPANRGTIFTSKEITDYLKKMNVAEAVRNYNPAPNAELLLELVTYMRDLAGYKKKESEESELNRWIEILS
ncbi:MAG: transglutaminase family protein [Chitinophagales bacterium]